MFTAVILAALIPLSMISSWWSFVNASDPLHRGTRKATHGAGIVALAVLAAYLLNSTVGIERYLAPGLTGERLYVVIGWCFLIIFGLRYLRTGWLLTETVFDAPGVGVAGAVKIAVGLAVAMIVWKPLAIIPREVLSDVAEARALFYPYGDWAVLVVVVWCLATGSTKLLIALRSQSRRQRMPPAVPNPRGDARDFTPEEALAAMRQTGGMRTHLDDVEF